ncbi:hypothetical protein Pmani_032864 [Petrolisthes manimaculis]|uniref:SEFIR domain-containing protein n=1 Tax=Petrolisthes manimaculis TaxID=1843537 RepID=A0AAE1TTC2_9EUCA|nr:hypothetical protein Pmani_032864 [Petrolisthes manimaculis]
MAGISCNDQLKHPEDVSCQFQNISSDCAFYPPSRVSSPDNLLFSLGLYYHRTWMTPQSALNLSFPSPTWTEMKFRYEKLYYGDNALCRRFTLMNQSQPLVDTLFWDCPFFPFPEDSTEQLIKLTLVSDEEEGGSYIFTRPSATRVDVQETSLQNWHTFFFVHVDYMYTSASLPITLQLAPHKFDPLSYNISLVKCVDGKKCQDRAVLASKLVTPSENDTEVTELLPTWSNIAWYAVTVQIVSPQCFNGNINNCYVAVSPPFGVAVSKVLIWMCIIMGGIIICAFTFFVVINKRIKQTRRMVMELKKKPVNVLFVYLPETQESLKLVNNLADFLSGFYIQPYLIDKLVGSQTPNQWTLNHLKAADRVLFLIPNRRDAEGVSHILGQWDFVLHLLLGYLCSRDRDVNPDKIGVITFPFSGEIPNEIISLKHFQLPKSIDPLLTWIHGRTWLDNIFLRCPLIPSMVYWNKDQLKELKKAITEASKQEHKYYHEQNCRDIMTTIPDKLLLETDTEYNSQNVEPVKNFKEDTVSIISGLFDDEIPSVYSVLEDNVLNDTQHTSNETVKEEGLDMSLLID